MVRTEPADLTVGKRALIEISLTEAVRSAQGVMASVPVEARSLMVSVVQVGSSGHGALAKPMVPRSPVGVYLVYHRFRAPGTYELRLVGTRSDGNTLSLRIPVRVEE